MKLKISILLFFLGFAFSLNAQETLQYNSVEFTDSLKLLKLIDDGFDLLRSEDDTVFHVASNALEIAEKLKDDYGIMNSHILLGYYYGYMALQYNNAIASFRKVADFFMEEGDTVYSIGLYLEISVFYYNLAEYNNSLDYCQNAIKLSKKVKYDTGVADGYLALGTISSAKGKFHEAIKQYQHASQLYAALPDSTGASGIGLAYNNIGDAYLNLKDFIKAKENFEIAIKYYDPEKNKLSLATAHHNLGIVYGKLGDNNLARQYFSRAQNYYLSFQGKFELAELYKDMAVFYSDNSQLINAIEFGEMAFELANEIKAKDQIKVICLNLSNYYTKIDNYKKAYENYTVYKAMSDSLLNEEKSRQFMEIESKYKINEKEKELEFHKEIVSAKEKQLKISNTFSVLTTILLIVLALFGFNWFLSRRKLKIANTSLKQKMAENEIQRQELQELNKTKDKLFSIIGHDLRNSIGSVYNFIELLLDVPDYSDTESIRDILSSMEKSFGATYNLLENLLYWAKSQQNRMRLFFEKQKISDVIDDNLLLFQSQAEAKEISLIANTDVQHEAVFDKNSVSLILRNLVSNAIKFTPKNGNITIQSEEKNGKLEVSVKDTGKGMTPEIIEKIFNDHFFYSSPGTMEESGSGLGLKLCKEFTTINQGEIFASSQLEKGSTFTFTLPLGD